MQLIYLRSWFWFSTTTVCQLGDANIAPNAVLRIRDVYHGPNFFHPGSQIPGQNDTGSRIRIHIENLSIFNPKIVSKLSEIWSGLFIPDPDTDRDLNFLPIPDPRSRGQKGTGSRIRIRNTGQKAYFNPTLNTQPWRKVYFSLRHNLKLSILQAGIRVCCSHVTTFG
jgi:hypothetical protein